MKGLTALLSLTNLVVLPGKLSDWQTTDRENGVRKPNICKSKCVGENQLIPSTAKYFWNIVMIVYTLMGKNWLTEWLTGLLAD